MSATQTQTTTADSPPPSQPSTGAQTLRAELKAWENTFAATNSGRKAGREDIKQHPEIGGPPLFPHYLPEITEPNTRRTAQKYKAYSKLRSGLSSALPVACSSSSPPPQAKKRKRPSADDRALSAAQPQTQKLSPNRHRPSAIDPYDLPLHLTPNPPRTIIGPTPQKNGLVLGLFDLLSPKRTPSKAHSASASQRAAPHSLATPSKNRLQPSSSTPSQNTHSTRAPPASAAITPTARRILQQTPTATRTSAAHPSPDDTPEFLRRSAPLFPSLTASNTQSGQALDDADAPISWSPVAVRLPRKPIGRSLSTLMQGLRDMEEEALDEELELLREIEGESAGCAVASSSGNGGGGKVGANAKVLVLDSQVGDMPLGPDGAGDVSSEEEGEARGRGGRAVKKWKKKGQKRSTRRVVMRPTVGKWKPEREWAGEAEEEEEAVVEGVVRETQAGDPEGSGAEEEGLDEEQEQEESGAKVEEKSEGKKAKPPRKVSATAHANFRALKIRNKQSKGKKGGRIGRR
ncbi:DNA replication regulator sld2 [Xylographa opegraphella]|nr:DNA replication regulator sld2 [Xylographa opegraphella]